MLQPQDMVHHRTSSSSTSARQAHMRTLSSLGDYESLVGVAQTADSLSKRPSTVPLLPGLSHATAPKVGRAYRRLALLLTLAGAVSWLAAHAFVHEYNLLREHTSISRLRRPRSPSTFTSFPKRKQEGEDSWKICPECNSTRYGGYVSSEHARIAKPSEKRLRSGRASKAELATFMLQDILLASNLEIPLLPWDRYHPDSMWMQPQARNKLFHNYLTDPDSILSFSFAGLRPSLPTLYMFTRTANHGRLSGEARYRYMRRHIETLKAYNELVAKEGYHAISAWRGAQRQLLWIVAEDAEKLDDNLAAVLKESGLPYLYIAHGKTQRWGKAQWNIVLKAIDVLRNNVFADGPILNVDDDAYILPELLRKVWKTRVVSAWQVGNFDLMPEFQPSQWEGPFYQNGRLLRWQYGGAAERTFRSDMNGFAIDSSVVGEGRAISGPQYAPHNNPMGENEFLMKIVKSEADIEPLCWDTREEKCYYSWHNHWMEQEQDLLHRAPTKPDYE